MDWITRWQDGLIGWHKPKFNQRLTQFLPQAKLKNGATIFVPLCGKSLDMIYLQNLGFKIIGVEISEIAIRDFFKENNLDFSQDNNKFISSNIAIYHKSFFDLTMADLGDVDLVYDRASLVALDKKTRVNYAKHLINITSKAKILLLSLNYNQEQMSGPPFAVNKEEITGLYQNYNIELIDSFNDIKNENKFRDAGLEFINKDTYLLF